MIPTLCTVVGCDQVLPKSLMRQHYQDHAEYLSKQNQTLLQELTILQETVLTLTLRLQHQELEVVLQETLEESENETEKKTEVGKEEEKQEESTESDELPNEVTAAANSMPSHQPSNAVESMSMEDATRVFAVKVLELHKSSIQSACLLEEDQFLLWL
jgi:hypothetical protein